MRSPWEWEEEDLLELITAGTQESIVLDYKRCDALGMTDGKKKEVSKDVSAFANSAGGTIVYGMIENGHVPTGLDAGFDPNHISKEWLEQVINSSIQRRIEGIRVKQVNLCETHAGKVAYVVNVPQSLNAPHQAADHRFYKRFNFESVPMEEYEIRDVAHRSEGPDLRIEFYLVSDDSVQITFAPEESHSLPFEVRPKVFNGSSNPAEQTVFFVGIDAGLKVIDSADLNDVGQATAGPIKLKWLQQNWMTPGRIPILENLPLPLIERPLKLAVPKGNCPQDFLFWWRVHSPRMSIKEGARILRFDGTHVRLLAPEEARILPESQRPS